MSPAWDQLPEGASPPDREYGPLTRTDFVRYVGASGDMNPIHHDDEYARAAGFPSVFAPGMMQAGLLASFATDWLGARNVRRYAVQFREQLWPGDVLVCSATVVRRYEDGGARKVDLELRGTRAASGRAAVVAEATFVVP